MVEKSVREIKTKLVKLNKSLMVAESCTGGLISSYLTDISGSSDFIKKNFVTYANEAKQEILGVSERTINRYGVVSANVAIEMVNGLIKKHNADFAISTTGVLGPKLYDDGNKRGTVFIGLASKTKSISIEYHSKRKTREAIKKDMVKYVLNEFLKFLDENS